MDDALSDRPFDYRLLKGDSMQLLYKGDPVVTLNPRDSVRLLNKLERADPMEQQRLLAKQTGQFKFGNERSAQTVRQNRRDPK